jgi:trimeric autotransporter adhesin
MATIITRASKGSPLENAEVDANFTNLNDDKLEATDLSVSTGAASGGGTLSYSAGVFTFAPADLSSYITDLSSFTTTDLTEGTNLYYTNERVDDRVSTLIVPGLGITTDYDDTAGTFTIDSDTIEELCKNGTGSTILKGTPVYQTGTAGNAMVIAPADASSAATMPAVGVLSQDLAAAAEGSLILMGRISGVDTSAFSEGDVIYVASGGGYTNVRPTGQSILVQNLGRVTKVHASNGGGVIMGAGRSNDVPNLTDGNIFIGNASGTYDKRAIVTADISDLTATATELNYTDGVTSNIQTQLNTKAPLASPTFTGTVTIPAATVTGDVSFGDSDKAVFGAGNDLQIYHDGSNSFIKDAGTGNLLLQGSNAIVLENPDGKNMIYAEDSGAVYLYHDGVATLATISTGINVLNDLTVNGDVSIADAKTVYFSGSIGDHARINYTDSDPDTFTINFYQNGQLEAGISFASDSEAAAGGNITLKTGGTPTALFADNGDISFYEDTGTTPKFFWDASAESLGIGLTPTSKLDVDGNISSTSADLKEIAATISDTAVDVFVYDTRKDSDGGAWRKRTQNTSWYNETLNTATRGSRREFPAVAVIVAESTQVTIYDGDDPDMPMWMVFDSGGTEPNWNFIVTGSISCVSFVNGLLCLGRSSGIIAIDFIGDRAAQITGGSIFVWNAPISKRNSTPERIFASTTFLTSSGNALVNSLINDVAMTVLPNAPIDAATGLPVPTIAVATAGGVSVIKDDGTVVDINYGSYNASKNVFFTGSNGIFASFDNVTANNRYGKVWNTIPSSDLVVAGTPYNQANGEDANYSAANITGYVAEGRLRIAKTTVTSSTPNPEGIDFALPQGVSRLYTYETSPDKGMFSLIASTYNTGWMNGDIKLATLSDTDDTDVTGSELNTDPNFDSGVGIFTAATGTVTYSSGTITSTKNSGSSSAMTSSAVLTVGKAYYIEFEVTAVSPNYTHIDSPIGEITSGQVGTHSGTFIAGSTTVNFGQNNGGSTSSVTFTRISIRIAEEDRSVNDNGLQVFGTITKNPVATGADLVAYSGFSASNYLEQPYNADLQFGTGDFCFSYWIKFSSIVSESIYSTVGTGTSSGTEGVAANTAGSGVLGFAVYTNGIQSSGRTNCGFTYTPPTNTWICVQNVRRSGVLELWINGELDTSVANTADINATDSFTRLGGWSSGAVGDSISLSLFRASATAPSPEQIAKIYEDEKFLFQENSEATLYGSSDSVTALAYDDDTELLHVGTSAGRSVFNGLRRIDNTTDAVGAAISASNGLVAED